MAKNQQKFWMVWSPQGGAPTHKHPTRLDADSEATRLAKANPGRQFFVLKAMGGFVAAAPEVEPIALTERGIEIPF